MVMSETHRQDPVTWQRWNMGDLVPAAAPATPADNDSKQQHAKDQQEAARKLRDLHESTRKQARAEGLEAGQAEGHKQGYAKGLEEGRAAGQQAFDERLRQMQQPLRELALGLRHALDHLDADIGDALTDIALAAARRLAGDALDAHPEHVLDMIRDLLREEPLFNGHPRLWLHPDDVALLHEPLLEEIQAAGWRVQPDSALERGGCRVSGPEGELDATRETRWQALLARARRYGSTPISHTLDQTTPEDDA